VCIAFQTKPDDVLSNDVLSKERFVLTILEIAQRLGISESATCALVRGYPAKYSGRMLGTKRNSSGSLATIFKRELPSTSATLEDGASFPTPVGFAAQENNPLPAVTIEHDALRAIDVMFFGQGNRIALHTRLPSMALSVCTFWVSGCTTGFSLPQAPIVGGRAHRLYHLSILFMTLGGRTAERGRGTDIG
jgi:hypothetical protein